MSLREALGDLFATRTHRAVPGDTVLRDFSRSLLLIADQDSLHGSVAARLQELFHADRLAIMLLLPDRRSFAPAYKTGFDDAAMASLNIAKDGRLARWLEVNEIPLQIDESPGVFNSLEEDLQAALRRIGVKICVPLMSLNRLTGLILLGSEKPDWSLIDSDLDLLSSIAAQAGLAFENAFLYQEQRDRLRRLYTAERLAAVGQLAATVAHEIRNPLTAIRSTIQYISRDYDSDAPKRALITELIEEVDRIDRILNGLLTLTRSSSLQLSRADAVDLVEQALVLISAQAENQGVRVERRWDKRPCGVMADPSQIKQVFINIILNALQSMPSGGTLGLSIESDTSSAGTPIVGIRFADSGCGIAREDMEKIFDPFYTTKREGTGLGLSISHGIIKRHDGEIDVTSEPGRGTVVTVSLPAAQ